MTTNKFKSLSAEQLLTINIFELDVNEREEAYKAIRDISYEEYQKVSPRKMNQRLHYISKRRSVGHDLAAERAEKELEEDSERYYGKSGLQYTKLALAILIGAYDDVLDTYKPNAKIANKAVEVRKSEL